MKTMTVANTKIEEVAFLQEVQDNCKSGSYLAGLFTQPMVLWVAEKIGTDEIPDLFEYFTQTEKEKAEAELDANTAKNQLKDCQIQLASVRTSLEHMVEQKENWKKQCEAEQTAGYNLSVELNNEIRDGKDEIDSLKSVVEDRDAQITALKAKLYDLMVK